MTRKWISRKDWSRIVRRSDYFAKLDLECFKGYAHLLVMHEVRTPFVTSRYMPEGTSLCLADNGYIWLMMIPETQDYVATAQMNEQGALLQIYIDIIAGAGWEEGDLFFDDIYLDVIMLPDGRIILDDEDEMDEALATGDITKEQYDRAYETARRVIGSMERDIDKWKHQIFCVQDQLINCLTISSGQGMEH